MSSCDPIQAYEYYDELCADTIYCNHGNVSDSICIKEKTELESYVTLDTVSVSLLGRDNQVQDVAGLNWGQREGRAPNQAYIQLRPEVYTTDFFPSKPTHFTVLTDDDKSFVCVRAQKNEEGTAIQTPHNNSLLGEYFRNRLGVANGEKVTAQDLNNYGRTDVEFTKLDSETFYLDYST